MKQNYIHFPFEQSILWSCASKPLLGIWYRKQRREEHSSLMLWAYGIWQHYHHFKHTAPISGLNCTQPFLNAQSAAVLQQFLQPCTNCNGRECCVPFREGKTFKNSISNQKVSALKDTGLQSFPTEGTQIMNLGTIFQHTWFKGWCSKLRSSEIYFSFKMKHEAKNKTQHYLFRNTQIFPDI